LQSAALKTLVIIPTYNEAENIGPLTDGIRQHAPGVDILFVDDNSQDGTQKVIGDLQAQHQGRVHLISRPGKLGLGTAYVAAFKWGLAKGYDVLVEMDADHSHRPEDLAQILDIAASNPVVIGSRYIPGGGTRNWSRFRQFISRGGSLYARTILGLKARDLTGGFNAWHRRVLEDIDPNNIRSEGYTFQVELKFRAHLAGYSLREVPILFVERRAGQSKMAGSIVAEAIYRIWTLAAQRGLIERQLAERPGRRSAAVTASVRR
jgi:dolichol-phosphate mannosyltransferase